MEHFRRYLLAPRDFEADVKTGLTPSPKPISGRPPRGNDLSAGGYVIARYGRIPLDTPRQHLYWNYLAGHLNDRSRGIILPILNDELVADTVGGIPHSDGALFSDGSGYAQAGSFAQLVGDHILNAGTITFRWIGQAAIVGGEWLSIRHPGLYWRAYRIWTIDAVDESGDHPVYTAGIGPTLRRETPDGTELDFAKPRFLAQLASGTTMAWSKRGPSRGEPSIDFEERFEVA